MTNDWVSLSGPSLGRFLGQVQPNEAASDYWCGVSLHHDRAEEPKVPLGFYPLRAGEATREGDMFVDATGALRPLGSVKVIDGVSYLHVRPFGWSCGCGSVNRATNVECYNCGERKL